MAGNVEKLSRTKTERNRHEIILSTQGTQPPPQECSVSRRVLDSFVPKPSPLSTKYCWDVLPDDQDIWIEGSYRSSTTGESIPYFRSLRTGKCRKMEPPSGARYCVSLDEISLQCPEIQAIARQKVTNDEIRGMPAPRPNLQLVEKVLLSRRRESHRQRQKRRNWLPLTQWKEVTRNHLHTQTEQKQSKQGSSTKASNT